MSATDQTDFPNNDSPDGGVGPWPSAGEDDREWQQRVEQELAADFPDWDVGFFPYRYGQAETGSHWGGQCRTCGDTIKMSGPIKLRNAMTNHSRRHVKGLEGAA